MFNMITKLYPTYPTYSNQCKTYRKQNCIPIAKRIVGVVMAKVGLHRRQLLLPMFRKWTQCKWNTQFCYLELEAQFCYLDPTCSKQWTEIVPQVGLQKRWLFWQRYKNWTWRELNIQHFHLELDAIPLSPRFYFLKGYNTYISFGSYLFKTMSSMYITLVLSTRGFTC